MPEVTDPLVLPEDIVFSPVSELKGDLRDKIGASDGDVAVSRPGSRATSKVVSAESAELLRLFVEPKSIAEAVVAYSRERGVEPDQVLTEAFTVVRECVNDQFLLPAASSRTAAIEPGLEPGDIVGAYRISSRIQTLADTEIYQASSEDGSTVAIKIARIQGGPLAATMLAHEARTLHAIGDEFAPRLLDVDVHEDQRAYLALSWCEGTPVAAAAAELRDDGAAGHRALCELCAGVFDAYHRLHERGYLHGDIHPGNVLVGADDQVWLIDFGLAQELDQGDRTGGIRQGGVAFFFEPEYAAAGRSGQPSPPLTLAAEQYSLCALAYHLLTGVYTHDFSLEKETMLRQIAEEPPLPFEHHGLTSLPAVEAVLHKGLSKRPEDRYGSVAELAAALRKAAAEIDPGQITDEPEADAAQVSAFLAEIDERCAWDGELLADGLPRAPHASINYGATGIAWLCYRRGLLEDNCDQLALADVWLDRARGMLGERDAFYNTEIEITEETVGCVSPYHSESGVHLMNALLADARGDGHTRKAAVKGFVEATTNQGSELDLTLGRSGIVLAAALLTRSIDDEELLDAAGVAPAAREALAAIWEELDTLPEIARAESVPYLGMAHGWAGYLYAALAWSSATGDPLPAGVGQRLEQLARLGQPIGRGLRWPWRRAIGDGAFMPGWCNGTAGYVFLWNLAYRQSGDSRWLRLAEKAAWNCWEDPAQSGSLCCGMAGRAYALLNWYKVSEDPVWIRRARRLAGAATRTMPDELRATESAGFEHSLYKGAVGLAALLSDLQAPERSQMPVFELPA